jgi:hypothetical protein
MKPIISIQDNIGKTVGRRKMPPNAFAYGMAIQKSGNQFRAAFGHGGLCPKGVFRFKTHQEADEWTMKMLIERATRKS